MKKASFRDLWFYALILVILAATVFLLWQTEKPEGPIYSEVRDLFEMKKVERFSVEGNELTVTLSEPIDGVFTFTYELADFNIFYNDLHELIDEQHAQGIIKEYDYPPAFETPWWITTLLPYAIVIIVMALVWYFLFKRAAGGGGGDKASKFGKARTRTAKDEKKKTTFADVAGADEEKEELQEIVEFLRSPKRFMELGARIPKGVLLVGPPGTGKTLIAKAVAGEAGVQFLSISGSDFVELYVGVGASRVRDLFDQAKKAAPAIIFIDEIDAVGRQRGAGLGGGHDEREQTLNQLLVEMDGFGNNQGVIVLAATNRPDILDPALLRPGRFDRQVFVGMPDIRGREAILRVHTRGKPLAEDVDLAALGKITSGFTGADLENLVNEGALLAARKGQRFITMDDLRDAMIKVVAGPEKRSKLVSERERKLTAYHEAGHAVVIRELPTHPPVHQISIIPRGQAGGMTIFLPEEDKNFVSRNEMYEQIVSLLGGRVAEQMILGDISTGASNDIRRASSIARKMVTAYGMSAKLGAISYESGQDEIFIGRTMAQARPYSEEIAAVIDEEVKALIDKAYAQCETILSAKLDKVEKIAAYLLEHETMEADAFQALYQAEPSDSPELSPHS